MRIQDRPTVLRPVPSCRFPTSGWLIAWVLNRADIEDEEPLRPGLQRHIQVHIVNRGAIYIDFLIDGDGGENARDRRGSR